MREDLRGERIGLGLGAWAASTGFACSAPGAFGAGPFGSGGVKGSGVAAVGTGSKGAACASADFAGNSAASVPERSLAGQQLRGSISANGGCSLHGRGCLRFRLSYILRHGQGGNPSEASCEPQAKHCPCNHTEPLLPTRRCFFRSRGPMLFRPPQQAGKLYLSQARAHAHRPRLSAGSGHVML